MTTARILGSMRSYPDLVVIIRARIAELGITHQVADDLAGLQDGYTSKLLAQPPIRRMSPWTFFLILDGLGLLAHVSENPERMARIASRVAKGRSRAPKRDMLAAASILELTPDFMRLIAIKGGFSRSKKLSAKRRSKIARGAALARWRKERVKADLLAREPAPGRARSVARAEPIAQALLPSLVTQA